MKLGTIFSAAIAFAVVGCATPSQIFADAEVDRLCAIDGGIRVYETVTLPSAEYERYAKRNWVLPNKKEAQQTDPYYYVSSIFYYREKNPQLSRRQHSVVRRSDGKILGVMVVYGRGGGDLPGPWHDSSYHCPDLTKLPGFETSIFSKEMEK